LFERAFSQSHYTLPSHASMLTGLSPAAVGVLEISDALDEAFETLAEQLSARGYRTGALVGRGPFSFIGSTRGFDQGFEQYHHWPYWPTGMSALGPRTLFRAYSSWINHHVGVGSIQITRALNWVERRRDEPFFLFLHLFDIHSKLHRLPYEAPQPYRDMFCPDHDSGFTGCHPGGPCASEYLLEMARGGIPEPLSGADLDRTICLYDGGIRFVDAEVGRFLDALQEMELYDDSLIVVVSDHGEAFFEHGRPLHSDFYNENLHVPLILRPPGGGGGLRVTKTVRVLDIAPTLLGFTPGRFPSMQGASLLHLSDGAEEGERLAFAQSHRGEAVQSVESKLIAIHHDVAGNPLPRVEMELYELLADPGEQNDVHGELEEAGAAWEARLSGHRLANEALYRAFIGESAADELQLPEEAIEELRSLGYL
jgi:arylsulfatase A-like enzyme